MPRDADALKVTDLGADDADCLQFIRFVSVSGGIGAVALARGPREAVRLLPWSCPRRVDNLLNLCILISNLRLDEFKSIGVLGIVRPAPAPPRQGRDNIFGSTGGHDVNIRTLSNLAGTLIITAAVAVLMALSACGADATVAPTPLPPRAIAATTPPTPLPPPATAAPILTTATAVSPPSTETAAPRLNPTPTTTPRPEPTPTPMPPPTEPQVAAGPALPASIVDVYGNEVVVDDISRIVVMNGDFTEVIYALGLGGNVVAVDTSATYPVEATELPKIGYQRRLSAEGVLSMAPTVVIGNSHAGPPEVLEQIRATGVPVVVLESVTTIDGAARKIRGIAQALGVSAKGEALATELEAQISEVQALSTQAQERPTAVFLYMRGLDTLFLGGEGHLSHGLFEASGAVSGGAALGVTEITIPLTAESLAAADPDCIVVLTRGLESVGGREGLVTIPGVGETAAAQQGCILDFDDQYFGGGGPRMGQVLMELLRAFHPDLAPVQ